MPNLQFEGCSNVLSTIPPAGSWLDGEGVYNCGYQETEPAEDVVELFEIFHLYKNDLKISVKENILLAFNQIHGAITTWAKMALNAAKLMNLNVLLLPKMTISVNVTENSRLVSWRIAPGQ
jgi:hypothetical protein